MKKKKEEKNMFNRKIKASDYQAIINMRHDNKTLQEIWDYYWVSRERIRQILKIWPKVHTWYIVNWSREKPELWNFVAKETQEIEKKLTDLLSPLWQHFVRETNGTLNIFQGKELLSRHRKDTKKDTLLDAVCHIINFYVIIP